MSEIKIVEAIWQINKCNMGKAFREQGWRRGEGTRLPPMRPGFDSGLALYMD